MPGDKENNANNFKRIDDSLKTINSKLDIVVAVGIHNDFQDKRLDQHDTRLDSHSEKINTLQQANAAAQPQVKRNADWVTGISMFFIGGVVSAVIKTIFFG